MRLFLAKIFRAFFRLTFFRRHFFGIQKRIIAPLNLFKGVVAQVQFKPGIQLMLHIDDWIQEIIYFTGAYEEPELKLMAESLNEGNVFIDIGANIGIHSLYASTLVGNSGRVISFEPFGQNFKALQHNIAINQFKNICSENLAVAEKDGNLKIYYDEDESNRGMVSSFLDKYSKTEKINAIALDTYLADKNLASVDFIKLDIEGGEFKAILGMEKTLRKYAPILMIEILAHDLHHDATNKIELITFLGNLGYRKYFISEQGGLSLTETDPSRMNFAFIKE